MKHDGAFDGRVARAVASRCAAVIGVSRTVVETLDGVEGPSVHVIRNGIPDYDVDRSAAARQLRAEMNAPEDAEVVIQVARIVANKGQRDTVEAAAAVLAERPRTRFAFVGTSTAMARRTRTRSGSAPASCGSTAQ